MPRSTSRTRPCCFPLVRWTLDSELGRLYLQAFSPSSRVSIVDRHNLARKFLETLVDQKHLDAFDADAALREFKTVDFGGDFKMKEMRLDDWWVSKLSTEKGPLFSVLKKVLILSHGNAGVERGFSANKLLLCENLEEDSLISVRHIKQAVKRSEAGVLGMEITPKMRTNVKLSSQRRRSALAEKKAKDKETGEMNLDRKRKAAHLKELEEKKKRLEEEATRKMATVEKEINKLKTGV